MGGAIIKNNVSLTCMAMSGPTMGLFEIVKVLTYELNELTGANDEYIDKSSVEVIKFFNSTSLMRYPRPGKFVFDNRSGFKQDFAPMLEDFDIEPISTTFKNPQASAPVEWVHQVILNILATKFLANKVFYFIYPWGETLVLSGPGHPIRPIWG